jgi:hypothetical protein
MHSWDGRRWYEQDANVSSEVVEERLIFGRDVDLSLEMRWVLVSSLVSTAGSDSTTLLVGECE